MLGTALMRRRLVELRGNSRNFANKKKEGITGNRFSRRFRGSGSTGLFVFAFFCDRILGSNIFPEFEFLNESNGSKVDQDRTDRNLQFLTRLLSEESVRQHQVLKVFKSEGRVTRGI
ncbi:hypothetical protein PHYBLDRAFT_167461 [Phycomyces blakesleeanus NRRL 1555(-)]|uniref:Uncharacterized protein n=1 Tax=Phycomyces blakesleeanus (strain ATCC 8743b / DSM 1359 / FGSC 10004 / NBRC 33097 / NRRL 1555) TaxID=763407 RepID=A0A162UC56_PHYB8|nr:hypothetical protein PHYBLDRAFT_167461 [Phycomyces blakesleeanus NRRL 1555(-)]OAD75142.1 hypothetical protein PHYBLDRAFT_167461 [Phycomyces blakesleeanus NRRL 1555(-)]|eukprot:XP_018293182.1 hypothetical protein PHYBLDRAFT_167461 [Phycomyces blakesleeanus NRRL 1555(-)]